MWVKLNSEELKSSLQDLGREYEPLSNLVALVADRIYADQLYAVTSHANVSLTLAPSYEKQSGFDQISIAFDSTAELFEVCYREWIHNTRNPPFKVASSINCVASQASSTVDSLVNRMLSTAEKPPSCSQGNQTK